MASLVGSRVERKEDKRFLTGKGQYPAVNASFQDLTEDFRDLRKNFKNMLILLVIS